MAEKRMFSRKITDADAFTDMPSTAQALYFHLNQGADDDGFNNQVNHAMSNAHASPDDLKMLLVKNFIIRFDSGVIVIKHWWMHNTLRKDRYTPTNFKEELALLGVKENKSYTIGENLIECTDGNQTATEWQPDGNQTATQIREDKNRLDKYREDISPSNDGAAETEKRPVASLSKTQQSRFDAFWKIYPKKVGKQDAMKAWKKIAPDEELTNTIITAVETAKAKDSRFREERFIPHPATWLNAGSWDDEFDDYFPVQQEPKPTPAPTAQRPAQRPAQASDDSIRKLDVDAFLEAAVAKTQRGG